MVKRADCPLASRVERWADLAYARHNDQEHLRLGEAVDVKLDGLNTHGAGERGVAWGCVALEVWS